MPLEQATKWGAIVKAGKFEPFNALMCLENWEGIIKNPSFRVKTINQVLTKSVPTPSLATLTKYSDERLTVLVLIGLISQTADFFKVGGRMSEIDIKETAYLLIDNYHFLTLADIKLCFQMGKAFKFGKLFDRFDGAIIMHWLDNYLNLRFEQSKLNRLREHHNKQVEERNKWTKQGIEAMKVFFEKLKEAQTVKEPAKPKFLDPVAYQIERHRQQQDATLYMQDLEHKRQSEQQLKEQLEDLKNQDNDN